MSRLLFAAARGARIQRQDFKDPAWLWEKARLLLLLDPETTDSDYVWRIHPKDEHLQYGPISTALLEVEMWELMSSQFPEVAIHAAIAGGLDSEWTVTWRTQGFGDRATALLILAEALADEGL